VAGGDLTAPREGKKRKRQALAAGRQFQRVPRDENLVHIRNAFDSRWPEADRVFSDGRLSPHDLGFI
jgi:hypothetical protein